MVTKQQAMTATNFIQVAELLGDIRLDHGRMQMVFVANGETKQLAKPINWRANGKCKTWKRDLVSFSLPIKHGMYTYGYLTDENAHLFEVAP